MDDKPPFSLEEHLAYLAGRIDGLTHLCAALMATHRHAPELAKLFLTTAQKAIATESSNATEGAYAKGFASVSATVEQALIVVRDTEAGH
jgi:hypothetical protein